MATTETMPLTIDQTAESQAGKTGMRIHTLSAFSIAYFTVNVGGTTDATTCYILDSSKNVLATSSAISSGIATFSPAYALSDNTDYFLCADRGASAYDLRGCSTGADFPNAGTLVNWTKGLNWNGSEGDYHEWHFNIQSFTTADAGTKMQINIGDAWKPISAMQINIGDAWKPVAGAKINIGDTWKTIF